MGSVFSASAANALADETMRVEADIQMAIADVRVALAENKRERVKLSMSLREAVRSGDQHATKMNASLLAQKDQQIKQLHAMFAEMTTVHGFIREAAHADRFADVMSVSADLASKLTQKTKDNVANAARMVEALRKLKETNGSTSQAVDKLAPELAEDEVERLIAVAEEVETEENLRRMGIPRGDGVDIDAVMDELDERVPLAS